MSFREKDFSVKQKRALKNLIRSLPRPKTKTAQSFLLDYVSFEAVARKVWNYSRKIKNKNASDSYAGIPSNSLKNSLKAFNVQLDPVVIEKLLSSSLRTRGEKSARNLRNALVHQWSEADCNEAKERFIELRRLIDKFLVSVKEKIK